MQGIFWLLFLTVISAALGKRIFSIFRIKFLNTAEGFLFGAGMGIGILSYFVFTFGLTRLLYPWVFYLLLVILLIFSMQEIKNLMKNLIKVRFQLNTLGRFEIVLLILLASHIIMNLIGSLAPLTSWDAVAYQLALPKVYLINHKIFNLPIYTSAYPANINMLYLLGLLINGEVLASLINFSFSVLVVILIYTFCRRFFSVKVALLAAVIYYAMPIVNSTSSSLMISQGITFFLLLSLYAFY